MTFFCCCYGKPHVTEFLVLAIFKRTFQECLVHSHCRVTCLVFFVPNVLNHQTVGPLNLITNTLGERMFSLHFTKEGLGTREELRQNLTLWWQYVHAFSDQYRSCTAASLVTVLASDSCGPSSEQLTVSSDSRVFCKKPRENRFISTIFTYLQGRNGDTDVENRFVDTVGKERVGWIGRLALTYTSYHGRIDSWWEAAVYSTGSSARCSVMT